MIDDMNRRSFQNSEWTRASPPRSAFASGVRFTESGVKRFCREMKNHPVVAVHRDPAMPVGFELVYKKNVLPPFCPSDEGEVLPPQEVAAMEGRNHEKSRLLALISEVSKRLDAFECRHRQRLKGKDFEIMVIPHRASSRASTRRKRCAFGIDFESRPVLSGHVLPPVMLGRQFEIYARRLAVGGFIFDA